MVGALDVGWSGLAIVIAAPTLYGAISGQGTCVKIAGSDLGIGTWADTPTKPAPGGGVWAPTSSAYYVVSETQFTMKHPDGRTLTFKKAR